MNLNIDDVYDNIESYRNKKGISQDQMAEIMGLATKQAYGNMIKNKTMKLSYFINLINKTGEDIEFFLLGTRKEQQGIHIIEEEEGIPYTPKHNNTLIAELKQKIMEHEDSIEDLSVKMEGLLAILDIRRELKNTSTSAKAKEAKTGK